MRLQILFCRQFLPPVDQKPCFFGCSPLFDLTKRLEHPAPGTGAPQIVAIARPGRILQPGTGRCIFSSLPFAPVSSFRTCSQAPRGLSSIYPLHSGSIRTLATIARSLLLDTTLPLRLRALLFLSCTRAHSPFHSSGLTFLSSSAGLTIVSNHFHRMSDDDSDEPYEWCLPPDPDARFRPFDGRECGLFQRMAMDMRAAEPDGPRYGWFCYYFSPEHVKSWWRTLPHRCRTLLLLKSSHRVLAICQWRQVAIQRLPSIVY